MLNSEPKPYVSVIIVTWNSAAYLPRCLQSLQAQTYKDFEVIVVDNASTDDTLSLLESFRDVLPLRLERLETNRGFAAANNIGARFARGAWLALLNSDAFPEPDWLEMLISASSRYPGAASFASRQLQAGAPALLDGAGDVYHISGLAWRNCSDLPADRFGLVEQEIFSPCAAAALYQKEAFLQVDGFDEDFFSYHEDVDLGFRLRLADFRSMYIPQAVVKHIGSASTGLKSAFAVYHGHRNLVWTYVKDMPTTLFWLYLPGHIFMNLFFLFYFSLQGQARAIWKAKWDALRGLPRMGRKRKLIQQARRAKTATIQSLMERRWLAPWKVRQARRQGMEQA